MSCSSAALRRLLQLPSALLLLAASHAAADLLKARQDSNTTLPAPLSFPPSENWDGIDGQWSSFTLRVGTPQQDVRTFLSFTSYQTWVVVPEGCAAATDTQACADSRGDLFQYNSSSTFDRIGIFDLSIDQNLGYYTNAIYGYDVVGLAGPSENGPTLQNTTVGGMALTDFYLGVFGVNPKATNFTSFNDPSPSYMTQLKQQGHIPSVSFGYNAGAHYRFTGTYASLTLGGYDTSRYIASNMTFAFNADNDHQTIVGLQSITVPSTIASSPTGVQLLPDPIYIEIDTTVSQIWLPLAACRAFEQEFGLVYDTPTGLYLVNDTLHQTLKQRNANITFTIGQGPSGGDNLQVVLPYAAFDLTATPPYANLGNESSYFPLRRAANDSQYILGRTFMQEAYITVDYEAQRFQLAQAAWDQNAPKNLQAILPLDVPQSSSSWTSSTYVQPDSATAVTSSPAAKGLPAGAIAGIVVGVVIALALLALLVFFLLRRRKQRRAAVASAVAAADEKIHPDDDKAKTGQSSNVIPKAELAGSTPQPFGMTHHDQDRKRLLSGNHSANPSLSGSGTPGSESYNGGGNSPYPTLNGDGTHSSSGRSPLSPLSEADSTERAVYEMPGDMPIVREKDGRQLSEKEALQHRERVYNGLDAAVEGSSPSSTLAASPDTPTATTASTASTRRSRMVNPDDVVHAETGEPVTRHRAFSFEGDPSESDVSRGAGSSAGA